MSAEDTKVAPAGDANALKDAVNTQVEFYLSNSNLPFDKFLFNLWARSFHDPAAVIASTPAPEGSAVHPQSKNKLNSFHLGWLPLDKLASFKRMQPYVAAPPEGLGSVDAIADVVNEKSQLVEARKFGNESDAGYGWYVRRKAEMSKPEDAMQRSVYAKGFPATEKEGETEDEKKAIREGELELQKKLEEWARGLDVGKVLSLRMRREDKPGQDGKAPLKGRGKFKGSVFIEFAEKSSVDKFLALDPKPTYEGAALEIKSKSDYVEEKRQLYAPGSKPVEKDNIPKNPYSKSAKPFNAWAERLIDEHGFPQIPSAASARTAEKEDKKKRKAEDDNPERDISYDGVQYKARKTASGDVEIVDEDKVGQGENGWKMGKLLRFTIASKEGKAEAGERFDYGSFKRRLEPIVKPAFVSIQDSRQIAGLPEKKEDAQMKSEFPTPLKAPPTVVSASEVKSEDAKVEVKEGQQEYPARGQASFKEVVTDEMMEKLKSEVGEINGRKVEWTRVSESDERAHQVSRARYHAEQAFSTERGGYGGRGGGRGGRGGGRGGRGGRGGGRGDNKRARRD
ncbi:hypothetical protein JCM10212_000286 [Sporobolomyces blumeae]